MADETGGQIYERISGGSFKGGLFNALQDSRTGGSGYFATR